MSTPVPIDPPLEPSEEVNAKIDACAADNPCEAAWQASYAYAADRAYDMAVYQALQMIAFGILEYTSADRTADMQYEIADRQMIIAEEEYERYKEVFIPCEEALNEEVCAIEQVTVEYNFRADRATRDVRRQFGVARRMRQRQRNKYCIADLERDLCNLAKTETLAVVAARDAAYRAAEERRDELEDERWTKKTWGVSLGRSVMTGQSDIYAGAMPYATKAVGAQGNAMRNLLGTLSGAVSNIMTANYAPQINAPSVFGVRPGSQFQTHWGNFNGTTITGYNGSGGF